MKLSRRVIKYAKENYNGVKHTTLNPEGPGVVRIHMIPPKVTDDDIGPALVILNGQDIIPLDVSWTILMTEFIAEVNKYSGREINRDEVSQIIQETCRRMRRVYPLLPSRYIISDIQTIMTTFTQIAYRETVTEDIPHMSIGEYAPYMKAPHRMDLMVSAMTKDSEWHCNLQCLHCYAAGQQHAGETELSTEEWKRILDRLQEIGVPQITFTGGEPTMRDDLTELIDYGQWFITRLNTNGVRLTKEYCHSLKAASLDSVQITLYSGDRDIHNRLVGADGYESTTAGIRNALDLGISISVNTPLCTLNKDYVSTLKYLHALGVTYVTCSGLITTGNAKMEDSASLRLTRDEISRILKDAVEYCADNDMEISFTSPGWVEDELCEQLGISTPGCGACLSNMAITPGGKVVPCQSWLSDEPLGDILCDEWGKIWDSTECRKRREFSAEMTGKCPLRGGSIA